MRRLTGLLLGLCVAGTALAEGDGNAQEARDILKKAAEALKKVKQVTYDFDLKGTGGMAPRGRSASGKIILGPPTEWGQVRVRLDAEMEDPSSLDPIRLIIGSDGENYYLVDHKKKMCYEDMDPAVLGSRGRRFPRLLIPQFTAEEPFKAEIAAEKIELRESVTIEGEECYQVFLEAARGPHTIWFLSKKDLLPRQRRSSVILEGETKEWGSWQYLVKNLVVNPELPENAFALKVPEGYTKTDDYAP